MRVQEHLACVRGGAGGSVRLCLGPLMGEPGRVEPGRPWAIHSLDGQGYRVQPPRGDCLGCRFRGSGSCKRSERVKSGEIRLRPLDYAGARVGMLMLVNSVAPQDLVDRVAQDLLYCLKRHEIDLCLDQEIPGSVGLVGESAALRGVDRFLESSTATGLPVVIVGEPGLRAREVAFALHVLSGRRGGFSSIDCAAWAAGGLRGEVLRGLETSRAGTLYLSRLHRLTFAEQSWLASCLRRVIRPRTSARHLGAGAVHVIASLRPDLDDRLLHGQLDGSLLGELDFLRLELPPLRSRPGDIRGIGLRLLRQLTCSSADPLAEETWRVLESYSWPRNVTELRAVLGRLVALSHDRPIPPADVLRHVPEVLDSRRASGRQPRPVAPADSGAGRRRVVHPTDEREIALLCAKGKSPPIPDVPQALSRALVHLVDHLDDHEMNLDGLARGSVTSRSHLGALFRVHLGVSPMSFLRAVRLERARLSLLDDPARSVTETAQAVGFSDLRHFERMFKRRFGVTPCQMSRSR